MTIALFGISSLYNSIQNFMSASTLLQASQAKQSVRSTNSTSPVVRIHTQPSSKPAFVARDLSSGQSHQRALRVMRIAEQGDAPSCAGRMVSSGRMADVCAELDRLVALEAKKKTALPH